MDTVSRQAWLVGYDKSLLRKRRLVIPSAVVTDKCTFDVVYVNLNYQYSGNKPLKLKEVIISEGVTTIGCRAFAGFKSLKEVILPSTITHIEEEAFSDCDLSMLTIPEGIEHIGNNIGNIDYIHILSPVPPEIDINPYYHRRYNNYHFVIPDGTIRQYLTATGWELRGYTEKSDFDFRCRCRWTKAKNIKMGNAYYTLDAESGRAEQTIFDTVSQEIEIDTLVEYKKKCYRPTTLNFLYCIQAPRLTIPEGITDIEGDWWIRGRSALEQVTLPKSLKYIGAGMFADCEHLQDVTFRDGLIGIGSYAFLGCHALTSLALPQGLLRIGSNAFKDCENITELVLPESLLTIGRSAFEGCTGLTKIVIPSTVRSIGSYAFLYDDKISSLQWDTNSLPQEQAPRQTKKECTLLWNVKRVENIIDVYETDGWVCRTWFHGDSITSVILGDSVETTTIWGLGNYLQDVTSLKIGKNVQNIGFWHIGTLDTINVDPDNPYYHFDPAGRLLWNPSPEENILAWTPKENTVIPQDITGIGQEVFAKREELHEIDIPEGVIYIGIEAFAGCCNLTDIHLPSTLRSIEFGAFKDCKRLQNIALPDSITELGEAVFHGCDSLYSIVLPESMEKVGYLGRQLKEIYCMSSTPPECNCNGSPVDEKKAVVYVPYGALHNYRNASGWKECKNLREMPPFLPSDGNNYITRHYIK